jgi:hypothetical protein
VLDSQQDTTSPGAWQRHCDEETVITHKTKAVPPSNLQESLTLAPSSSHGIARQPAQRSLAHTKEMRILIIPLPIARHLSLHACLLTFASVPNHFDPLACRKPKTSVSLPDPGDTSNPSWLHEIALVHASKPDPQPRWRCAQCWCRDLAYALWSDVAHTISTYTLLLYSQGYTFQGFVKQRLLSVCASQWQTPDCSILPGI